VALFSCFQPLTSLSSCLISYHFRRIYLVPFSAHFVRFDRQKQALQFIGRLVARVASSKRINELAPSSPVASFKMSFVIGITFPMADF